MLKTLYAKLLAVLVGLTVIMAVMFLIVIRHSDVARNQEINQKVYGNLASRLIHEEILAERDRADPSAVQQVFDRIRVVNPRIDVYLLDNSGGIVAASGLNAVKQTRVDLEPIHRFLDGKAELPIVGDDPSEGEAASARSRSRRCRCPATAPVISISCSGVSAATRSRSRSSRAMCCARRCGSSAAASRSRSSRARSSSPS